LTSATTQLCDIRARDKKQGAQSRPLSRDETVSALKAAAGHDSLPDADQTATV
jgi:hypothetical protein